MKKLLFILSLLVTSNLFAQVNTGKKLYTKVGGGVTPSDTSHLSDRINSKQDIIANLGDTSKYLKKTDTTIISIYNLGAGQTTLRGDSTHLYSSNISGAGTVSVSKGADSGIVITGTGGSGTVTSVAKGYGILSDGTITTTGTVTVDSAALATYFPRRKDSTVSFTTPYQSSLKQNISDSTTKYVTPTQLTNKATNWFNILKYGASPSSTSTQNTTAINNAIAAALPVSGTVYIPAGIYLVDSINYDPRVSLVGDGVGSILKSNSAVTMFTNNNVVYQAGTISNLVLDGNNIGTVGMLMRRMFKFAFYNVTVRNFTSIGLNMVGTLMGQVVNSQILNCPIGVNSMDPTGGNLIVFNNCQFNGCTTWAMNIGYSAGILVTNTDFEQCGTSANAATGAIHLSHMGIVSEGVSFSLRNSWLEANNGTYILIDAPNGVANYFIDKTIIMPNGVNSLYGVYVNTGGGSSSSNTLTIQDSKIKGFTTNDLYVTGSYATVNNQNSSITNPSIVSGAIYNNPYNPFANSFNTKALTLNGPSTNASIAKATSAYKNYAADDFVFYEPSKNMAFLNDNTSANISFAVGVSTPAFTIYNNYVNANTVTIGSTARKASFNLPVGNTTTGPLNFATGGSLTTNPVTGNLEFVNKLYFTYASGRTPLLDSTTASTTYQALVTKGTATLTAGTVTVNTSAVSATSKIMVTVNTPGGTQGFLSVPTRTAGTSFVINSTSATETSTVDWTITN